MTSPVTMTMNDAGKWEVRINDERQQLLGTFEDTTSRDLFVEAVFSLVMSDGSTATIPNLTKLMAA
jgi:hypothetical protein